MWLNSWTSPLRGKRHSIGVQSDWNEHSLSVSNYQQLNVEAAWCCCSKGELDCVIRAVQSQQH